MTKINLFSLTNF